MRKVLLPIFSILILLLLLSADCPAAPDKDGRALWVWSLTDDIIADYFDNDGIAREEFLSFCAAPHGNTANKITTLFMAADDDMNFRTSKLRRFLADMNNRGFKVYLILDSPLFAIPDNESIPYTVGIKYKNNINPPDTGATNLLGFIPYQIGSEPSEQFAGLMLDIEPHQLGTTLETPYSFFAKNAPEGTLNPSGFPIIWGTYKDLLTYTKNEITTYNANKDPEDLTIDFSDSIAGFYATDQYNPYDPDNGTPGDEIYLAQDIIDRLDFYTILAYKDTADPDNAFTGIKGQVNLYRNIDANDTLPYVITVETTKDLLNPENIPDNDTFYEEGHIVLETELNNVLTAFSSDPLFSGLSIHSYADRGAFIEGYQHLVPVNTSEVPIVTITSPNGSPVDGIDFTGNIQITWDAYIPRSDAYTVELFYATENNIDINNDSTWTSIDSISSVAPSSIPAIISGSYTWPALQTASISTVMGNRLFIIARISYDTAPALPTVDTTDYGVAINEDSVIADDSFSDTQTALIPGPALGLQMIPDNDSSGVLHAVYYKVFGTNPAVRADFGIYYTRSLNWGATWSAPVRISEPSRAEALPRKPSFHKNGPYLAIAWVENNALNGAGAGPLNEIIKIRLHNSNGVGDISSWQSIENLTTRLNPVPIGTPVIDYPDVYIDNDGDIHVAWHSLFKEDTTGTPPFKNYIHYIRYDRTSSSWIGVDDGGFQRAEILKSTDVTGDDADGLRLKTPSVIETTNGVHVAWGEYDDSVTLIETTQTVTELDNFDSWPLGSPANNTNSTWSYSPFGSELTQSNITEDSGDHYIELSYTSPTDGGSPIIGGTGPFASLGLAQVTDFFPIFDLSSPNTTIEFDLKSSAAIADVLFVEIFAEPLFGDNTPAGAHTGFRLGVIDDNMLDLPGGNTWTHFSIPVTELTTFSADQSVTSKHANLADVTKVQITILQTDADLTGSGTISIDNLKINEEQSSSTVLQNVMRIALKTKSGASWPTEDTIVRQRTYSSPQILPAATVEFDYIPVFFPEFATVEDNLYLVWQETVVGEADNNSLEEFSDVLFNKSYDGGTTWAFDNDSPQQITTILDDNDTGFNPDISVFKRDNDGQVILQVVYSDNFQSETSGETQIFVGDLIFRESDNSSGINAEGNSWSDVTYFAQRSNPANTGDQGIRIPYTNINASRARDPFSPPYIHTTSNNVTITNWLDRDEEKRFKLRGDNNPDVPLLVAPQPPFANLIVDGNNVFQGFQITWPAVDTDFTPNKYILERIEVDENGTETSTTLPDIFSLSYSDTITFLDGVYYRYRLRYYVGSVPSQAATSNIVKKDTQLLLDDFESYGLGETHFTGNNYVIDKADAGSDTLTITQAFITDGTRATELTFAITGTPPLQSAFVGFLNIIFPAVTNFSNFGSIDVRIKSDATLNAEIRLIEDGGGLEEYRIGPKVTLDSSGNFFTYHFFLDQIGNLNGGDGLNKDNIKIMQIVFTALPQNAVVVIDDIVLSNNPVLDLSAATLDGGTIQSTGAPNVGVVISPFNTTEQRYTPITLRFGNGKDPWYLRIYTDQEEDNEGNKVRTAGLVRKDNGIIFPEDSIPIKVWIADFGPARFGENTDQNGDGIKETFIPIHYTQEIPPVENDYFWKGFDFDGNGDTFGVFSESSNITIVEGNGPGEFPFDIDGDGFQQGDDFFADGDGKKLSENPSWLFVPLKLNVAFDELTDEDKAAVKKGLIMLPSDDTESILTWRILASTFIGNSDHEIDMYFAVAINAENLAAEEPPNNYGTYSATVFVDLAYN